MESWFYIINNQQHGPVTKAVLIEMLVEGTLPHDALVWTEGMKDWTAAKDIEDLIMNVISPPSVSNDSLMPSIDTGGYQPSGQQIHPWARFWARMMDYMLFIFLFELVIGFIYEPLLKINDLLFYIMVGFAYVFVEPFMLSTWGTTPGKAFLKIRLRQEDGKKLTYSQGLDRAFQVFLLGEGFLIPIISLFTLVSAFRRLTREGKTFWDQTGCFTVHHQIIGPLRVFLAVLIFITVNSIEYPYCITSLNHCSSNTIMFLKEWIH